MGWQSEAGDTWPDAEKEGTAAAAFLTGAVHNEVNDAQIGPVMVLARAGADASVLTSVTLYAAAVVRGPLRAYLATAWGAAGHVHGKRIVSFPTPDAAQAALDDLILQRTAGGPQGGYRKIGVYS